MRKIFLLAAFSITSLSSFAQKAKKQANTKPAAVVPGNEVTNEINAREIAMREQSRMSPEHRLMMENAGHWREEVKIWAIPGQGDPSVYIVDRSSMVKAEGRFLVSEMRGMMNNQPYEAQSVLGYDNTKRMFVKTWFDNFGTSILVLEGSFDEKTKTIDFRGTALDPISRNPVKIHQVLKMSEPTTQTLEIFVENKEGREVKSMEIKSSRG